MGKEKSTNDMMSTHMWKEKPGNQIRKMEEEKTVEELVLKRFWK